MMLSNSLQWPNKIGAQRKAAHPSPMGRRQWSAQRCAEQQKVRKLLLGVTCAASFRVSANGGAVQAKGSSCVHNTGYSCGGD